MKNLDIATIERATTHRTDRSEIDALILTLRIVFTIVTGPLAARIALELSQSVSVVLACLFFGTMFAAIHAWGSLDLLKLVYAVGGLLALAFTTIAIVAYMLVAAFMYVTSVPWIMLALMACVFVAICVLGAMFSEQENKVVFHTTQNGTLPQGAVPALEVPQYARFSGRSAHIEHPTAAPSVSQSSALAREKRTRKRFGPRIRQQLWAKTDGKCFYCDCKLKSWRGVHMHLDHRHPFSRGGSDDASNLVPACPSCNLEKSASVFADLESALSE